MNRVVAVIPARMESSRFPGKPLVQIMDLPMIEHVRRRVRLSAAIDDVYVATCNQEIIDIVEQYGGKTVMTANTHERCTDRVDEALHRIDADIAVIVQGDEPLLDPGVLSLLIKPIEENQAIQCTNLLSVIKDEADLDDVDIVKAAVDIDNYVMYFSRAPIPFRRVRVNCPMYRQTGLSAFTKSFLQQFSRMPQTVLERTESVDFLRILENRHPIYGVIYDQVTVGVDRLDDVQIVENILRNDPVQRDLYKRMMAL